jgi:DNA-binding NarL/FixJ family response regulator
MLVMTSEKEEKVAILATRSDSLAAGLSALLLSIPPIQQVKVLDDVEALVNDLEEIDPALIVVDTTLIGQRGTQPLSEIRARAPRSLRVFLTEDMSEYRQLQSATQETIFMKGTDPAVLARRLEALLKSHPEG